MANFDFCDVFSRDTVELITVHGRQYLQPIGVRDVNTIAIPGFHRIMGGVADHPEAMVATMLEYGPLFTDALQALHLGPNECNLEMSRIHAANNSMGSLDGVWPVEGEPLWLWLNAFRSLRLRLRIWDAISSGVEEVRAAMADSESSVADKSDQDVLLAARREVVFGISIALRGNAVPLLHLDRRSHPHLFVTARGLNGAIYAAFAREVLGDNPSRKECRGCGRTFAPLHGSQIYCDKNCALRLRMRRFRAKQRASKDT
jgi:hypothetical protein